MKTLLVLLGSLLIAVSAHAQQSAPVFVKMLQDVAWPDDTVSTKDSVELVLEQTETNYIIASLYGGRLSLPKSYGVIISADEAALKLLSDRNNYSIRISELLAERPTSQGTSLDQRPGYDPAAASRRYYARKAARDEKARRDAALAIEAQKANALQRQADELRGIRRELGR